MQQGIEAKKLLLQHFHTATTDIVLWAGLKPIYIDNDKLTLAMCLNELEQYIQTEIDVYYFNILWLML